MLLVAFSPNATVLAVGVLVAGMTAGFCWSPYNDMAWQTVRAKKRALVLLAVSTSTTLGIGVSGLVALAVVGGLPWRVAWLAFVAAAVLSAIMHALLLPGMPAGGMGRRGNVAPGRRDLGLFREGSAALFAVALSFGVVNAFYWSFNADIVSSVVLLLPNAGPILYAVLGAAGFAGLLTGDLVDRFGLERTLRLTLQCLGAGAVLLGVAPGSLAIVGASVVLYGAGVMFMSALLSLWSSAVLEERPSRASRPP